MTTIAEPIVLRALPDYEPKPGPPPRPTHLARRRLRVVADPPPASPPVGEVPPAVASRIRNLINQVLEAIDGRRPVVQLRQQFTPTAYGSIETRARGRTTTHRSRLRSLHAQQPVEGIVEACGIAEIDTRLRALAAQFEVREPLRCNVFRVL
ncbi:Rv3235 family protein [Kutzneria sp. CA-103260]|uniref:Rv3235 family protein n=1 Tax=Kutzneria sp. CA-103260 TaxID=2802641 RepID=UPI001BABC7B7|nr:Rv3235 family protein [Kutzneria sp. CA-103260]QUQ70966.1 hypothetical protein JJ691_87490 [Kutzneria sp. CA-103260]